MNRFVVCAIALSIGAGPGLAQHPTPAKLLDGRVSATLRAQVMSIVDSAERAGLPGAPLIDKALEGASKGADDRRIMLAVRAVAAALGTARKMLGSASNDELAAAAAALRGGVSPTALADVRRALPGRSLVVPLSVLGALVVQGTPPTTATSAVVAYAKHNDDSRLLDFGRDVAREIAAGIAPQAAVAQTVGVSAATPATPQPVLDGGGSTPATTGGGTGTSRPPKP